MGPYWTELGRCKALCSTARAAPGHHHSVSPSGVKHPWGSQRCHQLKCFGPVANVPWQRPQAVSMNHHPNTPPVLPLPPMTLCCSPFHPSHPPAAGATTQPPPSPPCGATCPHAGDILPLSPPWRRLPGSLLPSRLGSPSFSEPRGRDAAGSQCPLVTADTALHPPNPDPPSPPAGICDLQVWA